MCAPLQRERSSGEGFLRNRFMILPAGFVGPSDHAADEAKPRVALQGSACEAQDRILAGTAGTDDQNKHRNTPLIHRRG